MTQMLNFFHHELHLIILYNIKTVNLPLILPMEIDYLLKTVFLVVIAIKCNKFPMGKMKNKSSIYSSFY